MSNDSINPANATTEVQPTLGEFKTAYEILRPRLEQKPASDLTQFPLEGAFVVQTMLGVYHEIKQHEEAILHECPRLDPNLFSEVEQGIFALGHAESLKRAAAGIPEEVDDPMENVRTTRAKMKADLEPLVARGLLSEDALTLSQGNSPRNVAFDVLRFSNYMDQFASLLQGRMWTTPQELSQARMAAEQLLNLAGTKEQSTAENEVSLMYQRAFAHTAELYEELRWAVRYARRQFGDADLIAPSIYTMRAQRGPAKAKPTTEEAPATPTPAPADGTNTGVDMNRLDALMNSRPSEVVPRPGAAVTGVVTPSVGQPAAPPEATFTTADNRIKSA